MFRFLTRHREPLIVGILLLVPLGSFLASGHKGREPNLVDRFVLALSSPLQGALTWVADVLGSTASGYVALRGAHEEVGECRVALAEARADVNALKEARAENERLRRALDYLGGTVDQEILARVVGLNPSPQFHSLRIDRGEKDGVHAGMAVLTPVTSKDGLPMGAVVGQVVRAVGGSADVMLLTDPASRIGVVTQRSRVRGTASGTGDGKGLSLEFVLKDDDAQDQDAIVTAGTDGVFPRGLLVGALHGVKRPSVGMFLSGEIVPAVELHRLEEVLVVPTGALLPAASVEKGGGR